jgi:hypothetical protein
MLGLNKCGDTTQHIIAVAVYRDGAPVPAAQVTVYDSTLQGNQRVSTLSPPTIDGSLAVAQIAIASTNALGRFVVCVAHHHEPDVFELRMNDLEGSGVVRFTGFGGIQAVDLILGLPKPDR